MKHASGMGVDFGSVEQTRGIAGVAGQTYNFCESLPASSFPNRVYSCT